jgi:hypothetical protein
MEYWNNGMMEDWVTWGAPDPIIPAFQYSIIPSSCSGVM